MVVLLFAFLVQRIEIFALKVVLDVFGNNLNGFIIQFWDDT